VIVVEFDHGVEYRFGMHAVKQPLSVRMSFASEICHSVPDMDEAQASSAHGDAECPVFSRRSESELSSDCNGHRHAFLLGKCIADRRRRSRVDEPFSDLTSSPARSLAFGPHRPARLSLHFALLPLNAHRLLELQCGAKRRRGRRSLRRILPSARLGLGLDPR
jgi:hypothetical protein